MLITFQLDESMEGHQLFEWLLYDIKGSIDKPPQWPDHCDQQF